MLIILQENVVRDFELNELHLQCKKTPLSKHRDRKDAATNNAATATDTTTAAADTTTTTTTTSEASEVLADDVDPAVKKTQ